LEAHQQKPIKISVSQNPKNSASKPKSEAIKNEFVRTKPKDDMDWNFVVCRHCKTRNL
jgi:hypothetical protein